MKPFGLKELGQLKNATAPWGNDAAKVLLFILQNWIGFTKYCENMAGAFKTPLAPTLSFLVKYDGLAMSFYIESAAKPPDGILENAPAFDVLEPPAAFHDEEDEPVSMATLLEWKEMLNVSATNKKNGIG